MPLRLLTLPDVEAKVGAVGVGDDVWMVLLLRLLVLSDTRVTDAPLDEVALNAAAAFGADRSGPCDVFLFAGGAYRTDTRPLHVGDCCMQKPLLAETTRPVNNFDVRQAQL